ncbi:type III pantothenate kinase [Marinobacter nauticus]
MILLIDYGNTRLKWRLVSSGGIEQEGASTEGPQALPSALGNFGRAVTRVAVSMVGSEQAMAALSNTLEKFTTAPIRFYWSERVRDGLRNGYVDVSRMGADRWHAMLGAWQASRAGVAVVDAGSALTVDYIAPDGQHLGGYILPGLQMMRESLHRGAARVGFDDAVSLSTVPGTNTSDCVNHGLSWLNVGIIEHVERDVTDLGLKSVVITGGDAERLLALGLKGEHRPGLVFEGLALVDHAEAAP